MRLHQISFLILTLIASTTGCSAMNHGDPKNPKKNPHPLKRYEVIATSEAPGPWDSVKGIVFFDVTNLDCVPRGALTGGQNVPNIGQDFDMASIDGKTWKGYIYTDFLVDEDYFGKGVCRWSATAVTPVFTVHNRNFGAATWLADALIKGAQTDYFKRKDFLDQSPTAYAALDFSVINPEYLKDPGTFFPITVTVRESLK